jgi:transcriptional regulator with XRE-family HTH domain
LLVKWATVAHVANGDGNKLEAVAATVKRAYIVCMANLGASDLVGIRVRQARQQHGWTAKDLADRCAAAGAPQITPTVVTNLETRRRKTREVTVDELLVLALVLGVPPLQLIVPQDPGEELEVVPGTELASGTAADWLAGAPASSPMDPLSTPHESGSSPTVHWHERVARVAGREIRRHRDRQRLSTLQLAERASQLGLPIPRSDLVELESGGRDTVTVAEILVLAAALGVAPIELISPVGYDEQIELLPGRMMDPAEAAKWIYGERTLDVSGATTTMRRPNYGSIGEWSAQILIDEHESVLEDVRDLEDGVHQRNLELDAARTGVGMAQAAAADAAERDNDPETAAAMTEEAAKRQQTADAAEAKLVSAMRDAARSREHAIRTLGGVRAEMRRRGMMLPALPPSLKDLSGDDEMRATDGEG